MALETDTLLRNNPIFIYLYIFPIISWHFPYFHDLYLNNSTVLSEPNHSGKA